MPAAPVEKGRGAGIRPDPVPERHHARRSDRALPRSTCGSRRSARRSCRCSGALNRVLAEDVVAEVDVPGFDRSNVDGFAVQASDTFGAMEETPRTVRLNDEVLAPGVVPDEHGRRRRCDADRDRRNAAARRRCGRDGRAFGARRHPATAGAWRSGAPLTAGENVSYAGTDIATRRNGAARRTAPHLARDRRAGRPRAARRSPSIAGRGWRSSRPATRSSRRAIPCAPAPSTTPTPRSSARPSRNWAARRCISASFPTTKRRSRARSRAACESDLVVFSGGTSKGAGDLSYRVVSRLGDPGVVAHGVALKPGKPICLAVTGGKPVVILPGFPTSAIFTFHEFVAPVIRAYAGLPAGAPAERCRDAADARELRARTNRIPAGRAGAGTARTHGVSDGQGLRLRHDVQRRGRLHHDRPAHRDPRCRQHGVGAAPRAIGSSPPTS